MIWNIIAWNYKEKLKEKQSASRNWNIIFIWKWYEREMLDKSWRLGNSHQLLTGHLLLPNKLCHWLLYKIYAMHDYAIISI